MRVREAGLGKWALLLLFLPVLWAGCAQTPDQAWQQSLEDRAGNAVEENLVDDDSTYGGITLYEPLDEGMFRDLRRSREGTRVYSLLNPQSVFDQIYAYTDDTGRAIRVREQSLFINRQQSQRFLATIMPQLRAKYTGLLPTGSGADRYEVKFLPAQEYEDEYVSRVKSRGGGDSNPMEGIMVHPDLYSVTLGISQPLDDDRWAVYLDYQSWQYRYFLESRDQKEEDETKEKFKSY